MILSSVQVTSKCGIKCPTEAQHAVPVEADAQLRLIAAPMMCPKHFLNKSQVSTRQPAGWASIAIGNGMVGSHAYVAWQSPSGAWRLDGYSMSSTCESDNEQSGIHVLVTLMQALICLTDVVNSCFILPPCTLITLVPSGHEGHVDYPTPKSAVASSVVRTSPGPTPGDLGSGEKLSARTVTQTADGLISFSFFRSLNGTGEERSQEVEDDRWISIFVLQSITPPLCCPDLSKYLGRST